MQEKTSGGVFRDRGGLIFALDLCRGKNLLRDPLDRSFEVSTTFPGFDHRACVCMMYTYPYRVGDGIVQ